LRTIALPNTVEVVDRAIELFEQRYIYPNRMEPWEGSYPGLWEWRIDPVLGSLDQFLYLPTMQIRPTENPEEVRRWRGYQTYVEWAREGKSPPPIGVTLDDNGLRSVNRRRLLAAQDANRLRIAAWYSPAFESDWWPWSLPKMHFGETQGQWGWTYNGNRYRRIEAKKAQAKCDRCPGYINALDANGNEAHVCECEWVHILRSNPWARARPLTWRVHGQVRSSYRRRAAYAAG